MRDTYCMIGVIGWILGIFATDVGLGYLGVALNCGSEPRVLRCSEATEHEPEKVAFVTLTEFSPLLDSASYVTYDEGKTWSARVPLVPAAAQPQGASVRAVAAISGVRTQEEVAAAFSSGELTGLLLRAGRVWGEDDLQVTCPGIPIDFCRQLNVGEHPGTIPFGAGLALGGVLGFSVGFVLLVHGLFGIPDARPLNGAFAMVPLVFLVKGAGWLLKRFIPTEAAAPLAIGAGVFLFGSGAMQLHEQGLASFSPYGGGPMAAAFLVDAGFALLLLGAYFFCRKAPVDGDTAPRPVASASAA